MSKSKKRFKAQRRDGTPRSIGGLTITPESQALIVRWSNGAWIWNRPAAVRIEREDGTVERMPIVDVTRVAQWALGVLAAIFAAVSVVLTIQDLVRDNPNRRLEHE